MFRALEGSILQRLAFQCVSDYICIKVKVVPVSIRSGPIRALSLRLNLLGKPVTSYNFQHARKLSSDKWTAGVVDGNPKMTP